MYMYTYMYIHTHAYIYIYIYIYSISVSYLCYALGRAGSPHFVLESQLFLNAGYADATHGMRCA